MIESKGPATYLLFLVYATVALAAVPDAARGRGKAVDCKKVAFSVTSAGSKSRNLPLSFRTVLLDQGYGYNPSDGIFTTQCAGLYQFSFSGSGNVKLSLRKRPSSATAAWAIIVETGTSGGSQTIILNTQVNEQVAVFVDSGTPPSTPSISFTGYKIADAA